MTAGVFRTAAAAHAVEREYRALLRSWPVPSRQFELATRAGPTFVIASGPESAPPVVLLHGAQANSAAWLADVGRWSAKFRLYAVDVIGEAGLSAPVRLDVAGDAHAQWLDDVLHGLGLSNTAFVGTSFGGWLALDYAVRRPTVVDTLAVICPAGIGRQKNLLLKAAPLMLLGSWGRRKVREMVFGPAPSDVPDAAKPLGALMALIGRTIRPRVVKFSLFSDAQLAALRSPLLAVLGAKDALFDMHEARERLERHAPQAEVCFLDEGYHYLPDQGERVMHFLERHLL